ncbi:hypothetical protein FACS1894177_00110 [Bacteroidia bacterium]|nr:hypothetical protein FACS1894177_00110 [Bacteroidia bacterium]
MGIKVNNMEIKQLMQKMHDASNEQEKALVKKEIISLFSSLSEPEKETVRKEFLEGLDEKLKEADELIEKMDSAELEDIIRMSHETSLKIA